MPTDRDHLRAIEARFDALDALRMLTDAEIDDLPDAHAERALRAETDRFTKLMEISAEVNGPPAKAVRSRRKAVDSPSQAELAKALESEMHDYERRHPRSKPRRKTKPTP